MKAKNRWANMLKNLLNQKSNNFNIINFVHFKKSFRYLMMSTENDTTTFHMLAPQKGTYLLDIFAADYPNYEMCQKKEATKYINVCR